MLLIMDIAKTTKKYPNSVFLPPRKKKDMSFSLGNVIVFSEI